MLRDEFDFIKKIRPKYSYQSSLIQGIGDDAAIYCNEPMFDELICMDTMVEGVHFTRQTMTPWMIGFKALAVNISDIAAMGGIPTYYLVSIAIPEEWTEEELTQIYAGMSDLGSKYSMDLIGGDTVSSKKGLIITVTVLGKVEKGTSLLRSNAKPGDLVFVVGDLGASAAGLDLLLSTGLNHPYTEYEKHLLKAHQEPIPQVEAGRILACSGLNISLNDISDGLASETNELAEASSVDLHIEFEKVPRNIYLNAYPIEKQKQWCLFGGEDYQLVGTMSEAGFKQLSPILSEKNIKLTVIGEVTEGSGNVYLYENKHKEKLLKKGFNHFDKGE
ncbi:thiamine-phosphate kinase [Anaerobacillus alkaliphilus]|uniref:Thiamine-monophosphate kinase n=1 Tax=Anaerobacillus alkaliphilus TaxID=1548597 RepID=A0A4V1LGG5_9BACI|nr:thiamine-phosphate kinase [Anaerobacillus alkaliphilus]RXJ01325.1 thiamine-phosphate kinase [Anaerobacillus alkaliphilus]